jgi:uncharacterized protein (TIGR03435 family)
MFGSASRRRRLWQQGVVNSGLTVASSWFYNSRTVKAIIWLACLAMIQTDGFELATVKPTDPPSRFPVYIGVRMDAEHGIFRCEFCNMESMLEFAYGVKAYQISAPSWFSQDMFRVEARMKPGATDSEIRRMVQRLLEERFQLKLNRSEERVPVFEMTATPRGPKLTPSDPATLATLSFGNGYLRARKTSMSGLATRLSSSLGVPVVDKTGITGNFDIAIGWESSGGGALDADLIRVLRDQLGLVLTRSKAPVLRLIVASANKVPTEN